MSETGLTIVEHELRRRFGSSLAMHTEGPTLIIDVGSDATVHVNVDDASQPSFVLTYPCFGSDAHSQRDVEDRTARGVLLQAIVGIVGAVLEHGAVLPSRRTTSVVVPGHGTRQGLVTGSLSHGVSRRMVCSPGLPDRLSAAPRRNTVVALRESAVRSETQERDELGRIGDGTEAFEQARRW